MAGAEDVKVTLNTEVDSDFPLVVCVDLFAGVDEVFGQSKEIGSVTIDTVRPLQVSLVLTIRANHRRHC